MALLHTRAQALRITLITLSLGAMIGCDVNSPLEQVSRARHLSADLLIQFTVAGDAANRAVMADTDEASVAFAREAEQAKKKIQSDIDSFCTHSETLCRSAVPPALDKAASRAIASAAQPRSVFSI